MKKVFKSLLFYSTFLIFFLVIISWWQSQGQIKNNINYLDSQYPLLAEKPVVIRFITSTCTICMFESDNISRAETLTNVNIINIMVGSSKEEFNQYLKEHKLNPKKSFQDRTGQLFRQFNGKGVPTTVFINPKGFINHVSVGYTTTLGFIIRFWLTKN